MSQIYAVLTGDLVNSTQTDPAIVEQAFQALADAAEVASAFSADHPVRVERYRGDGWQSLISDPRYALRAALLFAAAVASTHSSIATRIAIGLGPVETLHLDQLGASDGAAFRESGRLLEAMSKRVRLDISEDTPPLGALPLWRRQAVQLAGALSENWTQKQALVMRFLLALPAPSQTEVAEQIGVSQQTVQKHFDTARGAILLDGLEAIEQTA